jgi:hypothetical protein
MGMEYVGYAIFSVWIGCVMYHAIKLGKEIYHHDPKSALTASELITFNDANTYYIVKLGMLSGK